MPKQVLTMRCLTLWVVLKSLNRFRVLERISVYSTKKVHSVKLVDLFCDMSARFTATQLPSLLALPFYG